MKKEKSKKSFKEIIFEVFYAEKGQSWYHLIDDYLISSLIALNVIAIILSSFETLHLRFENYFTTFEIISVVIFSIEYVLRLWVADIYYLRKKV